MVTAAICALVVAVLAGCGEGGGATGKADGRVVEVQMVDNAFSPDALTATKGETVTFRFTNNGTMAHDAFIGDAEAQEEHGKAMESDSGGHEAHRGEGIVLESGDSEDLSFTFEDEGEILIGCHQPGHYESGMKASITVS